MLCLTGAPMPVRADTLHLVNGRTISGLIKRQTAQEVELEVSGGSVTFKRNEVESIELSSADETRRMRDQWGRQQRAAYERSLEQQRKEAAGPQGFDVSEKNPNTIVVTAVLNGKLTVTLVLDTGAGLVVLQPSVARNLGLDYEKKGLDITSIVADGREIKEKYMVLDRMATAGMEASEVGVAIMTEEVDREHFYDGLLGMSFLKKFNFKIDYRNKKLILEAL
jgi:clan AA aspartic protease (TIGR02281 family)